MSFIGIRLHVVQMTYLNHLDKNFNTIAFITPSLAAIMYMLARSQRSKNWNHRSFTRDAWYMTHSFTVNALTKYDTHFMQRPAAKITHINAHLGI